MNVVIATDINVNKYFLPSKGYRVCKVIPNQNSWALLLNDYCCLSVTPSLKNYVVGPVITVEIKPKQGFPPIICQHEASVCRFSLKQAFKVGFFLISWLLIN